MSLDVTYLGFLGTSTQLLRMQSNPETRKLFEAVIGMHRQCAAEPCLRNPRFDPGFLEPQFAHL